MVKPTDAPVGVWLEVVALTCGPRYSMPLGIMREGGSWLFRLYPGVGLLDIARAAGGRLRLYMLSPSDPLSYLESYYHELEQKIDWQEGCPTPDPLLGVWARCEAAFLSVDRETGAHWYRCENLEVVSPGLWSWWTPYYRAYGCLVELLVLASKVRAGVAGYRGLHIIRHAEMLARCVERSAPGRGELREGARRVLQDIREGVGEA